MASVNKVILLGRLGRDPEIRYASEGGTAICHLALATSRRYKDRDGNRKEDTAARLKSHSSISARDPRPISKAV